MSRGAGGRAGGGGGGSGAGRVIAGSARGIRLDGPGEGTRPLGDRMKQTLFAILELELRDARVLDLFAGSGAAGIEALSRGAASATFVEQDAGATGTIKRNLDRTRLAGPRATVVKAEAIGWLRRRERGERFDIVILDPPYERSDLLVAALRELGGGDLLGPEPVVVAKHGAKAEPPARIGLLGSVRERRFGETTLTFYRATEAPAEGM